MKTTAILLLLIFLAPATHAQNYTLTFTGTGAATTVDSVHVQNLTQCTDTVVMGGDVLTLSSTVGIKIFADEGIASINIFPNPAAGNCTASFEAPSNENTTIEIYDAIGKRIAQIKQFLSKGQHDFKIQGISSGVYLLKIQSEKYSCTAKLLSNNTTLENLSITETSSIDLPINAKAKGTKNTISMLFHTGDTIMFKGYSNKYKTVMVLMPTQSQTVTFNFVPCTDADGNNYAVVQIGTQLWMAENLKTTKYGNGNPVPNVTDDYQWSNLTTGAYCYYNNDISNGAIYGALYNWYAAADTRKICPTGWHIPTDVENNSLITFLGGDTIAGGKMKENCSSYWWGSNTGATNESGFTALPGGFHDNSGFHNLTTTGFWWLVTEYDIENAWFSSLDPSNSFVTNYYCVKWVGYSMRCLKN